MYTYTCACRMRGTKKSVGELVESQIALCGGEPLTTRRVFFSDDAKWLFVCCGKSVRVYSHSSRELVHMLHHHTSDVTGLALNPKHRMQLLSSSLDGHLAVWDYDDGVLLRVIDFSIPLLTIAVRPGDHELSLFFVVQTAEEQSLVVAVPSDTVALSRSAKHAATKQLDPFEHAQQVPLPLGGGLSTSDLVFSHEGRYLCAHNGHDLLVYNMEAEKLFKYHLEHSITALASHPSKLCIATGNEIGQITLWYDFGGTDTEVVKTTLHWHAHSVGDVCFTTDGTYLISGGEESVLVLWQLETCKKFFRSRLGSPIKRISCCQGDSYFTVSLQSNVIRVVSGLNSEVEFTLGGLRAARLQDPSENGMKAGVMLDPRSRALVCNSTPGVLQFYQPERNCVDSELDVCCLNYVSRRDDKPLVLTTVEHAAFSPDGAWLVTVEWRDDKITAPELKMKLWNFNKLKQNYTLTTCVDPPHVKPVSSLVFQPQPQPQPQPPSSSSSSSSALGRTTYDHMLVSTSADGTFKCWVHDATCAPAAGGKQEEGRWACRSVGCYQGLPCLGAAFSGDGSLLVANFSKHLTLWDPHTCELRTVFSSLFPKEEFLNVAFGFHSSSAYLVGSTSKHLHVWDLLSCSVLWCVKIRVSMLVSDPYSSMTAAFVSNEGLTHLYLFHPSSPTPLAVHGSVCRGKVVGAAFRLIPGGERERKTSSSPLQNSASSLFFMSSDQELYTILDNSGDNKVKSVNVKGEKYSDMEEAAEKAFNEIFGKAKPAPFKQADQFDFQANTPANTTLVEQIFSAPSHVLPPMSSLSQTFLSSLLPVKQSTSLHRITKDEDCSGHQGQQTSAEMLVEPSALHDHMEEPTSMEVEKKTCTDSSMTVENYEWLFK